MMSRAALALSSSRPSRPAAAVFGRVSVVVLALLPAACAPFPEFETAAPPIDAPAPYLIPMEEITAMASTPAITAGTGTGLAGRAAALEARAAAMRGAVHDPDTRNRLNTAAGN